MEGTTIRYRLEVDGAMLYEEYKSVEAALAGAKVYFAKDKNMEYADVIKYIVQDMGIRIRNKDYEPESQATKEQ